MLTKSELVDLILPEMLLDAWHVERHLLMLVVSLLHKLSLFDCMLPLSSTIRLVTQWLISCGHQLWSSALARRKEQRRLRR